MIIIWALILKLGGHDNTERKLMDDPEELKRDRKRIRNKFIGCAEERNDTANVIMEALDHDIKDTTQGAIELAQKYAILKKTVEELEQELYDITKDRDRLRYGLECIYNRDIPSSAKLARRLLDGLDIAEEEHLINVTGDEEVEEPTKMPPPTRPPKLIWCPPCDRYKDYYCSHIEHRNIKPCNSSYKGFFCAKPMNHVGLHKSCGGVEWAQGKRT